MKSTLNEAKNVTEDISSKTDQTEERTRELQEKAT